MSADSTSSDCPIPPSEQVHLLVYPTEDPCQYGEPSQEDDESSNSKSWRGASVRESELSVFIVVFEPPSISGPLRPRLCAIDWGYVVLKGSIVVFDA